MKLSVLGFSQEKALELGLSATDLVFLNWFMYFFSSNAMEYIDVDGKRYGWVDRGYVISQLPILGITNEDVISRMLKRLEDCGVIERTSKRLPMGKRTYIRTTPLVMELTSSSPLPDSKVGSHPDSKVRMLPDSKVSSDSNTYDSKSKIYKAESDSVIAYLNEKAEKRFRSTEANTKHVVARLKEGFSVDDMQSVIDHKCKEWKDDPKMNQYLRPATLFAGKFESYLNAVPKKKVATEYPSVYDVLKRRQKDYDEA